MKILGVDPGPVNTGGGLLEIEPTGVDYRIMAYGMWKITHGFPRKRDWNGWQWRPPQGEWHWRYGNECEPDIVVISINMDNYKDARHDFMYLVEEHMVIACLAQDYTNRGIPVRFIGERYWRMFMARRRGGLVPPDRVVDAVFAVLFPELVTSRDKLSFSVNNHIRNALSTAYVFARRILASEYMKI